MKSLYDIIKIEFEKDLYDFNLNTIEFPFDNILSNAEYAKKFVYKLLSCNSKEMLLNISITKNKIQKTRFNHIVITYYLGKVVANYYGLFDKIKKKLNLTDYNSYTYNQVWLLTSLFHDFGYFENEKIKDRIINVEELKEYEIFNDFIINDKVQKLDISNVSLYTKEELFSYYKYKKKYLHDVLNHNEIMDHGILGGALLFSQYVEQIRKNVKKDEMSYFDGNMVKKRNYGYSKNILKQFKIICWAIMCHNVFKSNSVETDSYFQNFPRRLSTSNFKIDYEQYPLDFLLGIVDTLEYTKKLCIKDNNDDFFSKGIHSPLSISKSIDIEINENSILIDYSRICNDYKVESFEGKNLNNYISNIYSLRDWINLDTYIDIESKRVILKNDNYITDNNYESNYFLNNCMNKFVVYGLNGEYIHTDEYSLITTPNKKNYFLRKDETIKLFYEGVISLIEYNSHANSGINKMVDYIMKFSNFISICQFLECISLDNIIFLNTIEFSKINEVLFKVNCPKNEIDNLKNKYYALQNIGEKINLTKLKKTIFEMSKDLIESFKERGLI